VSPTAWLVFATTVFGPPPGMVDEELPPAIAPGRVLEQFPVAKGGDRLLVPVRFAGRDRLFVLDTGCAVTTFDESLPLGESQGTRVAKTGQGDACVRVYETPQASLGRFSLDVPFVFGADLRRTREASHAPIEGILGMDFLWKHIIHIDFQQNELSFLESLPDLSGPAITIWRNEGGIPEIVAKLDEENPLYFLIDTGMVGPMVGSIEGSRMKDLVDRGRAREMGTGRVLTPFGTANVKVSELDKFRLNNFTIRGAVFMELENVEGLGLAFWSRFDVTLDFPRGKLYLSPAKTPGAIEAE
jgi:hypothetical protein